VNVPETELFDAPEGMVKGWGLYVRAKTVSWSLNMVIVYTLGDSILKEATTPTTTMIITIEIIPDSFSDVNDTTYLLLTLS
jgi:hypothetical protein